MTVNLENDIVNSTTGLPVLMQFTLSSAAHPAFGIAQGGTNLTVPAPPSQALFMSPTANDSTPLQFTIAALPPGRYDLFLPTLITAPAAVLTIS